LTLSIVDVRFLTLIITNYNTNKKKIGKDKYYFALELAWLRWWRDNHRHFSELSGLLELKMGQIDGFN